MRLRHPDGSAVLVSYCTNVHPAHDVDDVLDQLDRYALPIREKLGWPLLGLGLWLPWDAASRLAADRALLARLRRELMVRGLAVVTMNGFPYQQFHRPEVKKRVYQPDWTDRRRLDYTLALASILTELLPEDVTTGSISTLPLGWREGWTAAATQTARCQLDAMDLALGRLAQDTGRTIRVGLEPEPGCLVESAADVVAHLSELGGHIGVCLDTCHLAVAFEEPAAFLAALAMAERPLVKLQAACAVEAPRPADRSCRRRLDQMIEPRYLHQVRTPVGGGVQGVDDLPEAAAELPVTGPWRVHFHAPLHQQRLGGLPTTQAVLTDALATVLGGAHPATCHIEVETYTWEVLAAGPLATGRDLVAGIANELAWLTAQLQQLGLEGETVG